MLMNYYISTSKTNILSLWIWDLLGIAWHYLPFLWEPCKGPSINDGGRGVAQCVTNSTDRLRECVKKGEGSEKPEI